MAMFRLLRPALCHAGFQKVRLHNDGYIRRPAEWVGKVWRAHLASERLRFAVCFVFTRNTKSELFRMLECVFVLLLPYLLCSMFIRNRKSELCRCSSVLLFYYYLFSCARCAHLLWVSCSSDLSLCGSLFRSVALFGGRRRWTKVERTLLIHLTPRQ